jgi:hypothetical protein
MFVVANLAMRYALASAGKHATPTELYAFSETALL